jgi:hypothetical protein
MLKKHKNELFQIIQNLGIDWNLVRHTDNASTFTIEIINTPFRFEARNPSDSYESFDCRFVRFSPNYSYSGYLPDSGWCSFIDLKIMFTNWLQSHPRSRIL